MEVAAAEETVAVAAAAAAAARHLQLGVVLLGALLAARDDRVDVLLLELAALRVEDCVGA